MSSHIAAMKRQFDKEKKLVYDDYLAKLKKAEEAEKALEEARNRAHAETKQEAEKYKFNQNDLDNALLACREGDATLRVSENGESESEGALDKIFKKGGETWRRFCWSAPILPAYFSKQVEVVKFLLEKGVDPTMEDPKKDSAPAIEVILSIGTDAWGKKPEIERNMYELMINRVLKDVIDKSEISWFLSALTCLLPEKPHQVVTSKGAVLPGSASALINWPIPGQRGLTPMMVFAIYNRLDDIRCIDIPDPKGRRRYVIDFSKQDENGKTIFDHAFEWGHRELIEWIVTRTERVLSELEKVCMSRDLKEDDELLARVDKLAKEKSESTNNVLLFATLYGHKRIVEHLIKRNVVNVQARDNAAIIIATRHGHLEICKALEAAGADITARNKLPIFTALENQQKDERHGQLTEFLLMDCPIQGHGRKTALHLACQGEDASQFASMLKKGRYLNTCMSNGQTPLHLAAHHNQTVLLEALLREGANFDLKDHEGLLPEQYGPKDGPKAPVTLIQDKRKELKEKAEADVKAKVEAEAKAKADEDRAAEERINKARQEAKTKAEAEAKAAEEEKLRAKPAKAEEPSPAAAPTAATGPKGHKGRW